MGLLFCSTVQAEELDAIVEFASRSTLSIPVSGQINQVNVAEGQRVDASFVMVALDKTPFEAALAQVQAEVTARTTDDKEAARDLEHAKELYDRGVLSTVELQNVENARTRAQAQLESAHARLKRAQYDLAHAEIVAPTSGWVLKVQAVANESVNSEVGIQPLIVFAAEGKYKARSSVPLRVLQSLKVGQPGKVTVRNKTYKATLSSMALEPKASAKDLYEVEFDFDSDSTLLQAGQTAKLEF
jgi:multidrug efflux system membrane fusion protein